MKVWPKAQFGGATLLWVRQRPSLVVTLKERDCPLRLLLLCQFWPQFRDIGCQSVVDPLMETAITSPAPPTLVIRTRLKNEWPLIVNLTPPLFLHGTLNERRDNVKKHREYKITGLGNEWEIDCFDHS